MFHEKAHLIMTNLYSIITRHIHDKSSISKLTIWAIYSNQWSFLVKSAVKGDNTKMTRWCTATVNCSRCDCPTQRGEQGKAQEQEGGRGSLQPEGGVYKHSKSESACVTQHVRGQSVRKRGDRVMRGLGSYLRSQVIFTIPCFLPALPVVLLMNLLKYPLQSQTSTLQLLWKRRGNHTEPSVEVTCNGNGNKLENLSRITEIKGQLADRELKGRAGWECSSA